mmetsp:Transcript_54657/g.130431  ORF Transcript_54657/g.130431 Transcript_54657/m.130431 type:complete len:427 (-) Transcript_54657:47-1327(-)
MCLALLILDPTDPLEASTVSTLSRYVEAFFCTELRILQVPEVPMLAKRGLEALKSIARLDIRVRPGRGGPSDPELQVDVWQLLECMKQLLLTESIAKAVDGLEGVTSILGVTANELLTSHDGLLPDAPAPPDRTQPFAVHSKRLPVGAISLSKLPKHGGPVTSARKFERQLLTLVSHSFIELMRLRLCDDQRCLAHTAPFKPDATGLFLCPPCEERLLRLARPKAEVEELVDVAAGRFRQLQEVLQEVSVQLGPIRIGLRTYDEFEAECDWLKLAEEIMRESGAERKRPLLQKRQRRRCFMNCLLQAHEGQPIGIVHRTWSVPTLRKSCLVDMMDTKPHTQTQGDLGRWTNLVTNRKHRAGGEYIQLGGSLQPKTIGGFVETGLNASFVKRQGAHPTMHLTSKSQEPLYVSAASLPACRKRFTGAL